MTTAMTMTDEGISLVQLYERYRSMIDEYGQPIKNDKETWYLIDLMTKREAEWLAEFAFESRFIRAEERMWIMARLRQTPFCIRKKSERHKSSHANKVLWKLLMNACEVIESKL